MKITLEFNSGETASDIVNAVVGVFGSPAPAAPAQQTAAPTLHPMDNPAAGVDAEDAGAASTATHDAEGSPWDARIHSDKKTMTEKNVWRKRKGVAPPQIAAVQAELRAAGKYAAAPAPAPVVTVPAGPGATATIITPPAAPAMAPLPQAVPPAPPLPAAPVETPYSTFVNFVAGHLNTTANPAGRLTEQWVSDALKSLGVVGGTVVELQHAQPEQIKTIHNTIANALGVPGV